MLAGKRQFGRYFTTENPFEHVAFFKWADRANLRNQPILEPFAGQNSLITHLQALGLCHDFTAFDIAPLIQKSVSETRWPISRPAMISVSPTHPGWRKTQPPIVACLFRIQAKMISINSACRSVWRIAVMLRPWCLRALSGRIYFTIG